MYLPKYCTDDEGNVFHDLDSLENEAKKHNGISYCPWCYDPMLKHKVRKGCAYDVNSSIYVLDDRLYDYIKNPNLLGKKFLLKLLNCYSGSSINAIFGTWENSR